MHILLLLPYHLSPFFFFFSSCYYALTLSICPFFRFRNRKLAIFSLSFFFSLSFNFLIMIYNHYSQPVLTATSERIPTTAWGPFTIVTITFVILVTCLILNCNRIRRRVSERRGFRTERFEKRHKQDIESSSFYLHEKITTPDSVYSKESVKYDPDIIKSQSSTLPPPLKLERSSLYHQ